MFIEMLLTCYGTRAATQYKAVLFVRISILWGYNIPNNCLLYIEQISDVCGRVSLP